MEAALAHPCARPFYPDWVKVSNTGETTLSWPALSGWPNSPTELERKNAAHRAIPGSNPYFVDTQENVYEDVASDEEARVVGEDPPTQLQSLIQVVDGSSVAQLLKAVENKTWPHGTHDDLFLAVSLHLSEKRIAELLGCSIAVVGRWFDQARKSIFEEHVRVRPGRHSADKRWPSISEQDKTWRGLVQAFKESHVLEAGGWEQLQCCEEGRIEEAFAEAAALVSTNV